MSFQKEFGEQIRKQREKNNLTQLEFAQMLGYSTPQFVSLFERGLSKVPPNKIKEICDLLGLPVEPIIKKILKQFETNLRSKLEKV